MAVEALKQVARRRRTAEAQPLESAKVPSVGLVIERLQDRHPDSRHAGRKRHPFTCKQVKETDRVKTRAGQHESSAGQGGRIGQAPGVSVEHRDDGQDHVTRADTVHVGEGRDERVQDERSV